MGNHKFRLSNMMPNAWLHKLKYLGREAKHNNTPSINRKHSSSASTSTTIAPSTISTTSARTTAMVPHTHKPRQQTHHSYSRKSYYYTRGQCPHNPNDTFYNPQPDVPNAPRKSTKHKTPPRKSTKSSSTSAGRHSRRASTDSVWWKPETMPDHDSSASSSDSSQDLPNALEPAEALVPEFRLDRVLPTESSLNKISSWSPSPSRNANRDTIIHVDQNSFNRKPGSTLDGPDDDTIYEFELPSIITKPAKTSIGNPRVSVKKLGTRHEAAKKKSKSPRTAKVASSLASHPKDDASLSAEITKEQKRTSASSKLLSARSPGFRVRANSPRLVNRKLHQDHPRKSLSSRNSSKRLSESFAVVKSSFDPQRDFKESMVEMIVENNLKGSKDLEDLLTCYLSLNSEEYHEVIIEVFKQIWFDLSDIKLRGI